MKDKKPILFFEKNKLLFLLPILLLQSYHAFGGTKHSKKKNKNMAPNLKSEKNITWAPDPKKNMSFTESEESIFHDPIESETSESSSIMHDPILSSEESFFQNKFGNRDLIYTEENSFQFLENLAHSPQKIAEILDFSLRLDSYLKQNNIYLSLRNMDPDYYNKCLALLNIKIYSKQSSSRVDPSFDENKVNLREKFLLQGIDTFSIKGLLKELLTDDLENQYWFSEETFIDTLYLHDTIAHKLNKEKTLPHKNQTLYFLKELQKTNPNGLVSFLNIPDFNQKMQPILFKVHSQNIAEELIELGADPSYDDINGNSYRSLKSK